MDEREIVASNVRDDAALAFYRTLMHFNGASNTIMFVTTMWLLATKTPVTMKAYRWYLVNISVCAYALDALLTLFFVPIALLPLLGGCTTGLLAPLGPLSALLSWASQLESVHNWLLGMTGTSLVYAFLYRIAALHNKIHVLHSWPALTIMCLVQLLYTIPCVSVTLTIHRPEEELLLYVKQNYPEIADFYAANACSIITTDMPTFLPYIGTAFLLLTLITVSAFSVYFTLVRRLSTMKKHVSKRTFEMHRSLTKALILQMAVPTGMLTACYFMFATVAVTPTRYTRGTN